jgi:hypothetical protein
MDLLFSTETFARTLGSTFDPPASVPSNNSNKKNKTYRKTGAVLRQRGRKWGS